MNLWHSGMMLLAQAEGNPPAAPTRTMFDFMIPMAAILALFYFLMIRPQQREESKRKDLLKSIKKNDRVVTIGGIIGSIANITPEGTEVTLKVDDNTRIKMLRSSIQRVLSSDEEDESTSKKT